MPQLSFSRSGTPTHTPDQAARTQGCLTHTQAEISARETTCSVLAVGGIHVSVRWQFCRCIHPCQKTKNSYISVGSATGLHHPNRPNNSSVLFVNCPVNQKSRHNAFSRLASHQQLTRREQPRETLVFSGLTFCAKMHDCSP